MGAEKARELGWVGYSPIGLPGVPMLQVAASQPLALVGARRHQDIGFGMKVKDAVSLAGDENLVDRYGDRSKIMPKATDKLEDLSKQLYDLQRNVFDKWAEATPSLQSLNAINLPETWDKNIEFGEEVVRSALEVQALATQMSIEAQKQIWEGYFEMIRRTQSTVSKS